MTDDKAVSELLSQLDAIANAPLTGSQRESRARPLLEAASLSVAILAQRIARVDLPWTVSKAKEYGVSPQTWLHAVRAVNVPGSESLSDLLHRLHQAEVAVRMLGSGYSPAEDDSGRVKWSRESGVDPPDAP
jgi:hypothetical protein